MQCMCTFIPKSVAEEPPVFNQGWESTISAESLLLASLTSSLQIRSLAKPDIADHSASGNSNCPSCMEWKRSSWHALHDSPWFQPHSEPQLPENGGYPHSNMYMMTPRDQRSHLKNKSAWVIAISHFGSLSTNKIYWDIITPHSRGIKPMIPRAWGVIVANNCVFTS